MPFDGVGFSVNEYSQKIDAVIDLIGSPERWGKGSFRSNDGRYCLRGAIRAVDKREVLGPSSWKQLIRLPPEDTSIFGDLTTGS